MEFNSSKHTIKEIIEKANFEYLTNGRSKRFEEIENSLISEGDIPKIIEFAQCTEGVNLKAIEYCVSKSSLSYPNLYMELAMNVKGINITALEDRLIKCKSELTVVQYFAYITHFACYIKKSDVNKLLREIINYPLNDSVNICNKINLCAQIVRRRNDVDIDMLNRFVEYANSKVCYKKDNHLKQELRKLETRRKLDADIKYFGQDDDLAI